MPLLPFDFPLTIERHCKRRLLRKKITERVAFHGDLTVPLAEYPVININSVDVTGNGGELRLDPRYYSVTPDCGIDYDIPFTLSISSFVKRLRGVSALRVDYRAGYTPATVPADLGAACLELASWNFGCYRGRRVGLTGSVAGKACSSGFRFWGTAALPPALSGIGRTSGVMTVATAASAHP